MNLLLNAAQAMSGTGGIWIELQAGRESSLIEFHDDGPGFSKSDLVKVFEPFHTTKSREDGTGLDLSICRKLVGEHGGEISAAASPHGGAVVTVKLPLRDPDDS